MKTPILSERMSLISESPTMRLNALVQSMKKQGVDVVNLTAGEPDFVVHDLVKQAVTKAVEENHNKYTPAAGLPELRQLVAEKTNRQQPSLEKPHESKNVVVTNGGKQALFNALFSLVNPGEEVLIGSPYWVSYPEMIKLSGGVPKFLNASASNHFKLSPQDFENAIHSKTKAVILNSPSNPTGVVYSKEEYRKIAEVFQKNPNLYILSDEIYDRINFGETPFCSFLETAPFLQDRCITINGMSKSFSMTGWRVGWMVAPEKIAKAVIKIQGQTTSGINSLAQWASIAGLKISESEFISQVETYKKRRQKLFDILTQAPDLNLIRPEGAFYCFVGVGAYLKEGEDSIQFAEKLLQEARVAVVPGSPFGEPHFVRLSFATDDQSLKEGCDRIVQFLQKQGVQRTS